MHAAAGEQWGGVLALLNWASCAFSHAFESVLVLHMVPMSKWVGNFAAPMCTAPASRVVLNRAATCLPVEAWHDDDVSNACLAGGAALTVGALLELGRAAGLDPNAVDSCGYTALEHACSGGSTDVMQVRKWRANVIITTYACFSQYLLYVNRLYGIARRAL